MTLQDCFDYRRWAASMLDEVNAKLERTSGKARFPLIDQHYYLKYWLEKFDRCVGNFTCWHEHHVVYVDGLKRLKDLVKLL